jgi:HSP20 family molecular chaperone IbpA
MPGLAGPAEHAFDFAHPVESDSVNARWHDGTLVIVLPKKPGRRIVVE